MELATNTRCSGCNSLGDGREAEIESPHFYHTGSGLVQELEYANPSYDVKVDYLAGSRRYMPDEAEADQYRYYAEDHLGSVTLMTDLDQNKEHYTYDAWGEHAKTDDLPSTPNRVRYGGARVECFVRPGTSQDAIYHCGERHYWPAYGRFLQRDPVGYLKMPAPSNPLGAHPYIYAENNPIMKKDLSGQAPTGYYRGARMGGQSFFLGTDRPTGEGQIIDCCADGYTTLDPGQIMGSHLWNTMLQGSAPLSQWASWAGWGKDTSLCEMDVREAQPNLTCTKEFTFGGAGLMCTYLEICLGDTDSE